MRHICPHETPNAGICGNQIYAQSDAQMNTVVADFEIHLSHIRPGFRCYACGDDSKTPKFTAAVTHRTGQPATNCELDELVRLLRTDDEEIRAFYQHYNGVTLYCDTCSDDAGISFFPINQWASISKHVHSDFREMGLDKLYGELLDGVAIGEICHSANFFIYQTSPARRGAIYYLMHDPLYEEGLRFDSFSHLLEAIVADPAGFLYDLGCYTRYSDGMTDTQWIPKGYVEDREGV